MQSLNVVFHVGLNKLLTKPAYDVTVMDDLALGVHHCLALTIRASVSETIMLT